jgi:hypothetical protein
MNFEYNCREIVSYCQCQRMYSLLGSRCYFLDECMIERLFEASCHREKFLDLSLYVLLHSAAIAFISWDMLSVYSLFAPSLSRALKKCLVLLSLNAAFCVFRIGLFGTFHNLPW